MGTIISCERSLVCNSWVDTMYSLFENGYIDASELFDKLSKLLLKYCL